MKVLLFNFAFFCLSSMSFAQTAFKVLNNTTDILYVRPAYEFAMGDDCLPDVEPIPACVNPGSDYYIFNVPKIYNVFKVGVYKTTICAVSGVIWDEYGISHRPDYAADCGLPGTASPYTITWFIEDGGWNIIEID